MAVVFAATHRNGSRAAVKVLNAALGERSDIRTRFLREGMVGNHVDHPGVVRVIDDDVTDDGLAFLVMELLEGETLKEVWKRSGRKLPLEQVVHIGAATLDILEAAHAKGVIHRDIKPENLFLLRDGKLKLLDFGIARLREGSSSATLTGALLGTPAFMAPEQALARWAEVDTRSDLFSLGATMFTLASGKLVHEGQTAPELLVAAASRPARRIASVLADVPTSLSVVIDRALAFERDARWASAAEMREALPTPASVSQPTTVASSAPRAGSPKSSDTDESPDPDATTRDELAVAGAERTTLAPTPEIGSLCGPFRLEERIVEGEPSLLAFLALDTQSGREVCVVWRPSLSPHEADAEGIDFTPAAPAFHHPNLADVYGSGARQGGVYVATEVPRGRLLQTLLPAMRDIPLERRLHWLLDLAHGLEASGASGPESGAWPAPMVFVLGSSAKVFAMGGTSSGDDPGAAPLAQRVERGVAGAQTWWGLLACQVLTGDRCEDDPVAKLGGAGPLPIEIVRVVERVLSGARGAGFTSWAPIIGAIERSIEAAPRSLRRREPRRSLVGVAGLVVSIAAVMLTLFALWQGAHRDARPAGPLTPTGSSPIAPALSPLAAASTATTRPPDPALSGSTSESASPSDKQRVKTSGGSPKQHCVCRNGEALCGRTDAVACQCRTDGRSLVCPTPDCSSAMLFLRPASTRPHELVGQWCDGYTSGADANGVPDRKSALGKLENCSATCNDTRTYSGFTGGICRGTNVEGQNVSGKLDCD